MTEGTTPPTEIALSEVLANFAPTRTRKHPSWTWADEANNVVTRMCLCCGRPGHYQQMVEAHIAEHGMDGLGVYLHPEGFVGDGHHRIIAAMRLGIERIPLESRADAQARWVRHHGPVSWEDRKNGDV